MVYNRVARADNKTSPKTQTSKYFMPILNILCQCKSNKNEHFEKFLSNKPTITEMSKHVKFNESGMSRKICRSEYRKKLF